MVPHDPAQLLPPQHPPEPPRHQQRCWTGELGASLGTWPWKVQWLSLGHSYDLGAALLSVFFIVLKYVGNAVIIMGWRCDAGGCYGETHSHYMGLSFMCMQLSVWD